MSEPPILATCAACGAAIEGKVRHAIHRDGFGEGPEVPLCEPCGAHPTPTCEELWRRIAERRAAERARAARAIFRRLRARTVDRPEPAIDTGPYDGAFVDALSADEEGPEALRDLLAAVKP
jgi:hypothetical protein